MSQFQALYDLGKARDTYDLDLLTAFRATRFQQSIDNNPYFFNNVFSGVLVQPVSYTILHLPTTFSDSHQGGVYVYLQIYGEQIL